MKNADRVASIVHQALLRAGYNPTSVGIVGASHKVCRLLEALSENFVELLDRMDRDTVAAIKDAVAVVAESSRAKERKQGKVP